MTKGRDTKQKESKKKAEKTLKEKRADKAAKREGRLRTPSKMHDAMVRKS